MYTNDYVVYFNVITKKIAPLWKANSKRKKGKQGQ